jgi:hypothetical protein
MLTGAKDAAYRMGSRPGTTQPWDVRRNGSFSFEAWKQRRIQFRMIPTGMFEFFSACTAKGSGILLSHTLSTQRAVLVLQHKFYAGHPKVR